MSFRMFVAFIAMLMATNAISIDSMLPALPQIGQALGIEAGNHVQLVVTAYLLGFGAAQIIYGTLSDRFGRRPVLIVGLVLFVLASLLAMSAPSFEVMMVARVVQGVGAAATRVLAMSIVRDCYSGRQMARVMSLAFIVFLAVPILAPSIGQIILLVAPWRGIFGLLVLFGVVTLLWVVMRLPETLHPEDRTPISLAGIRHAVGLVLGSRVTVFYTLAMTMAMGCLFGFINSAQQIFAETFKAPHLFTTVFALIALFMALSSLLNARIVGRLGMRKVSHTALFGFIIAAVAHGAVAVAGYETLWTFAVLQSAMMFCFGLMASNFNAVAMEPVGHVAGTASSLIGFASTVGGALLGFALGQHFDGTTLPLTVGFGVLGCCALAMVLIAERGRLFHAGQPPR
ncbi:multidrug effflux MFS transporter [Ancylobacter sp. 6x-1]|uniref:Bcr/CflA family efflux transporter n=1 Tax=Ancylobacter crimeensis TaxID=2579147 RepID=A0ABT0D9A8_9HYPH|nr:multidrug effflux MFS transporter [Ancylobacter crimeensis]MCK0196533.1 multidrug effflux MFS transporter [Ancylobacter crimeensis]